VLIKNKTKQSVLSAQQRHKMMLLLDASKQMICTRRNTAISQDCHSKLPPIPNVEVTSVCTSIPMGKKKVIFSGQASQP
jgi:hypothetical protein